MLNTVMVPHHVLRHSENTITQLTLESRQMPRCHGSLCNIIYLIVYLRKTLITCRSHHSISRGSTWSWHGVLAAQNVVMHDTQ
jgi:hypothetical protein